MNTLNINSIVAKMRRSLKGPLLVPNDDGYDSARAVFNNSVDVHPAMIAQCFDVTDVQTAVKIAGHDGVPVSVKGGSHDWEGRAVCEGGLVIDLSHIASVEIDREENTATIGGGVRAGELIAQTSKLGMAAVTGTASNVGMGGLLLGGGYGLLNGRFGLATDSLVSAEVVLADGRVVHATTTENPDLLWALKGGGGNFGVVTSFKVRLYRLEQVLAGACVFPLAQAGDVLKNYQDFMEECPDDLGLMFAFLAGPQGQTVLVLIPLWSGPTDQGIAITKRIAGFGMPVVNEIYPQKYADTFRMADSHVVKGQSSFWSSRLIPKLNDHAIDTLVKAAEDMPSPESAILGYDFHGTASRVPPEATAFSLRQDHYMVQIAANWKPADTGTGDKHRLWATEVSDRLAASALSGGYVNYLRKDESDRVHQFFDKNVSKLLSVKRTYDPTNTFRSAPGALWNGRLPEDEASKRNSDGDRFPVAASSPVTIA